MRTNVRIRETRESDTLFKIFLNVGNLSKNSVKWKAKKKGWIYVAMNARVPYIR